MSQQPPQRGGGSWRFKGRGGRSSPYGRDGGGGGGGGYRKVQHRNNRGGGTVNEADRNPLGNTLESGPGEERMAAVPQSQSPVIKPEATSGDVGGASPGHAQTDTPPRPGEKKYSVKARLFVGNLPKDYTHDVVKEMFQQFGEVKEVFVQREKSFGFVRMAYKSDAELALASLDGKNFKGRDIKVRFAASNSSVKVSNLHHLVSNELLEEAFVQFGEVEKAVVVTDERGKSLGYGIVDFSRKGFAQNAIRRCSDDNFLLTKSPMPVLVAEYIRDNDEEGQPERYIPKNSGFRAEREAPPRFSVPSSVEHAVATQWKMAYESEKRQREELEQHLRQARNSLINEMENVREQHQTELLRQELAHHQQEQLRLVQQLRRRQGGGGSSNAPMPDPPNSGGMSSLFPIPPPGDRPLEGGGMLETAPPYGGGPPGLPPVGGGGYPPPMPPMSLLPPPLMGQNSCF